MAGKVKKNPKKRNTRARPVPRSRKFTPSSIPDGGGTIRDPQGQPIQFAVGSADPTGNEMHELLEQAADQGLDVGQRWLIRTIPCFSTYMGTRIKKCVVAIFRPGVLTPKQKRELIHVSDQQEFDEKMNEARNMAALMFSRDYFVLEEERGPSQFEILNRQRLMEFIVERWEGYPVHTMGDVDFWYDNAKIDIPREKMITTAGREELFSHISDVLDVMERGFEWDSWTQSLRRIDEKGKGPWSGQR